MTVSKRRLAIVAILAGVMLALAWAGVLARPAPTPVPPVGGGVISFPFRQGGDPANWGSDGVANYPVTNAVLQAGAARIPSLQTYTTIYFPQAYQYAPLVTASGIGSDVKVVSVSTNGFLVEIGGEVSVSDTVFNWMAVGE